MPSAQTIPTTTVSEGTWIKVTDIGVADNSNYKVEHSKEGVAYTSGNTTTSISGYGASKTIKIPQITTDEYGHVTAADDESITITMPSA
jgi:hypothetical protein